MAKQKKTKETKHFNFTIDALDPKYKDLIDFLESIDNGSRSFVIRQILKQHADVMTKVEYIDDFSKLKIT